MASVRIYTPNELWKAIVYRDPLKAARVVNYYAGHSKKEIIPLIFPVLFSKLHQGARLPHA
ncbi:MAG: hypothetical protein MZV63_32640 [Marinilabiliales bacterium]|nr:hypothetical protein [Marinilabiliales bacterium]